MHWCCRPFACTPSSFCTHMLCFVCKWTSPCGEPNEDNPICFKAPKSVSFGIYLDRGCFSSVMSLVILCKMRYFVLSLWRIVKNPEVFWLTSYRYRNLDNFHGTFGLFDLKRDHIFYEWMKRQYFTSQNCRYLVFALGKFKIT